MESGIFGLIGLLTAAIALGRATTLASQVKLHRRQIDLLRNELKLPPADWDPRDANGWKIQ